MAKPRGDGSGDHWVHQLAISDCNSAALNCGGWLAAVHNRPANELDRWLSSAGHIR